MKNKTGQANEQDKKDAERLTGIQSGAGGAGMSRQGKSRGDLEARDNRHQAC